MKFHKSSLLDNRYSSKHSQSIHKEMKLHTRARRRGGNITNNILLSLLNRRDTSWMKNTMMILTVTIYKVRQSLIQKDEKDENILWVPTEAKSNMHLKSVTSLQARLTWDSFSTNAGKAFSVKQKWSIWEHNVIANSRNWKWESTIGCMTCETFRPPNLHGRRQRHKKIKHQIEIFTGFDMIS